MYILDLNSHQWRHVENSGTVVQGRASHCCCVGPAERDIYMFGVGPLLGPVSHSVLPLVSGDIPAWTDWLIYQYQLPLLSLANPCLDRPTD